MSDIENTEGTEGPRSQMWKHEDLADFLATEKGLPEDADIATVIAFAFAYRNEYRKSERYRNLVKDYNEGAEARAAEAAAAKEAAKAEKAAEREAKAAERAAAKEAAAAEKSKSAADKKTEADTAPAPVKATRKGKGKGTPSDEDPFG